MKNCIRLLFLLLLTAASLSRAGGVHQPESSKRLDALLSPLQTLSARFAQTVSDAEGYELQALTGTMIVARPGKIYWKSDAPYEQLVVSDASTLWVYDQDLEQVSIRPFDNDIANTPAVLFIGKVAQLEEKYQVSSLDDGKGVVFTLVPRDLGALYEKLTLTFADGMPVAMSLWDTLGQKTRIDFEDVTTNQPVDESLFTFEIPKGVDVLYDH